MDRERLIQHLNERYCSKREMITRIPLGIEPNALWQDLLNLRRSGSTALPLYSCHGMPYWYVTTNKMIAASERIVEALLENEAEFDPYVEALPVSTLEEVFYTSFVEGSQMTMQAAMEFLTGEQPPRDIEEQMIANNRMAGSYASGNLYRRIDLELLCELASILTEGMDRGGRDFRNTEEVDFASAEGEAFSFHAPLIIRDSINELCDFLSAQDVHPLIKAAVAQAYLLILRPFPEGNERLGRILSSMILLRAGYTFFSDVSLSALIARKGYAYYGAMVNILREENSCDLTYFIEYYLELLSRAVDERRLRAQRREEQARQAEMELAKTVLSAPVPVDPPQPVAKTSESPVSPVFQEPTPVIEGSELLDGFFSVAPTDHVPWSDDAKPVGDAYHLGRLRDALYALADSGGILARHEVDVTAAEVGRQVLIFRFCVQRDDPFPGFPQVGQDQLHQEGFALAGVSEDQNIAVGLILAAAVKIREDVGAELVPTDIDPVGVGFAGKVERVKIGHRGSGKDTFELRAELIGAGRQYREKTLFLPQGQTVHSDFGPRQLHSNILLQFLELFHAPGLELNEHGAVQQRLTVLAELGQKLHHVLQVALCLDRLGHIVAGGHELVSARSVLHDLPLLPGVHQPVVHPQGHAAAIRELGKDRLGLGSGRILPDHPHTAVAVAHNVVIPTAAAMALWRASCRQPGRTA